jgi:predicted solute-binding protein
MLVDGIKKYILVAIVLMIEDNIKIFKIISNYKILSIKLLSNRY